MDADADAIAGGDPSMEVNPQLGFEETNYLEQFVHGQILLLEVHETGVEIATKLLKRLKDLLEQTETPDVKLWLKSIKDLESRAIQEYECYGRREGGGYCCRRRRRCCCCCCTTFTQHNTTPASYKRS